MDGEAKREVGWWQLQDNPGVYAGGRCRCDFNTEFPSKERKVKRKG